LLNGADFQRVETAARIAAPLPAAAVMLAGTCARYVGCQPHSTDLRGSQRCVVPALQRAAEDVPVL